MHWMHVTMYMHMYITLTHTERVTVSYIVVCCMNCDLHGMVYSIGMLVHAVSTVAVPLKAQKKRDEYDTVTTHCNATAVESNDETSRGKTKTSAPLILLYWYCLERVQYPLLHCYTVKWMVSEIFKFL
jgi:hypothetical protein